MLPNLIPKTWTVFGLKGSGKTTLVKQILSQNPASIVVDPNKEYRGFNRYMPTYVQKSVQSDAEQSLLVSKLIIPKAQRIDMVVWDEANIFFPSKPQLLPSQVDTLLNRNRHFGSGISLGFVARRPSQLYQDITEMSDYMFIFSLVGRNDLAFLENMKRGLSETVAGLQPFQYVMIDPARNATVMQPIPMTA